MERQRKHIPEANVEVDRTGSAVLVFLDGVGIGPPNPDINPFLNARLKTFHSLIDGEWPVNAERTSPGVWRTGAGVTLYAADARLDTDGRPQSGTGTTSLLTGINAAAQLGRHAGPFPPADLRPTLGSENIFTRVHNSGGRAAFANAFPPFYFDRLERGRARRTTMTQAALAAGVPLRTAEDLTRGEALSAFITLERWHEAASDIPLITPYDAGANLARIARENDFTAFEYFRTDHIGHRPDMRQAQVILSDVDALLAGLFDNLDRERDLVVIASDHGNCEDLSTTQHTLNPVPITVWGANRTLSADITRITDVTPFMLDWLGYD